MGKYLALARRTLAERETHRQGDHQIDRPANNPHQPPTAAESLLRATLHHIEYTAATAPAKVCERIGDLVAQFGPIIAGLFLAQDLDALRCALLDLERNIRDVVAGRGCDNRPACAVCRGSCQWCNTLGIIRCGACLRLGKRK
jgi:hypothetical protein